MLSATTVPVHHEITPAQYELWLVIPDKVVEPLTECGVFPTRDAADAVSDAVHTWLRLGAWGGVERCRLDPDVEDDVHALRVGLLRRGHDMDDVRIEVRAFGLTKMGDNGDSRLERDWYLDKHPAVRAALAELDADTVLAPGGPEMTYHVFDVGD